MSVAIDSAGRQSVSRVLGAAGIVGLGIAAASSLPWSASDAATRSQGSHVTRCTATDGDTLRCDGERIRLLGIDAPEIGGRCRAGRRCAAGDPDASRSGLQDALEGDLQIERVGRDKYGRTLAIVTGARGNLSCWQLSQQHAEYKATWDNGLRVARTCPSALFGKPNG